MKRVLFILLSGMLLSVSASQGASVDNLVLMSEQFPPYNFEENGKPQGTSIDLLALILKKLDSKLTVSNIAFLPWARGYNTLLTKRNTALFVVTRTPERETLFKWAGPISTSSNVLIARKDRHIKLRSIADAKKYKIGVVPEDAAEQLLTKAGIVLANLDRASDALANIRKLDMGRIDLFAYDEAVTHWLMKKNGINPDNFETVIVQQKSAHYFAFHRDTPDEVISKFQSMLDQIKLDGTYDKIMNRYLK